MKELVTRTLAGAVFAGIVIASTMLSEYSFLALLLLVQYLAFSEFRRISSLDMKTIWIIVAVSSGLILTAVFLVAGRILSHEWLVLIPLLILFVFIAALFSKGQGMTELLGKSLLPLFWISLPLTVFMLSGWIGENDYNPFFPLAIIVLIWIFDTTAYLTGMLTGRHKMFPNLSPKKSWEGFAGGLVLTSVIAAFAGPFTSDLSHWQWALAGIVTAVTATLGDFAESRFKREYGVKDSGAVIPGHGGILDRFDSLFFTAPALYALFLLF